MKKNYVLEKNINFLKENSSDIAEIDDFLKCYLESDDDLEFEIQVKAMVFSEFKDIYTKGVLEYGDFVASKQPWNKKFNDVLATRHKRVGNIERYGELMGFTFSRKILQDYLEYFKRNKTEFPDILKFIENYANKYSDYKVDIYASFFSVFKDIYTKDVLPYGEYVAKSSPANIKFITVFADRYKKVTGENYS